MTGTLVGSIAGMMIHGASAPYAVLPSMPHAKPAGDAADSLQSRILPISVVVRNFIVLAARDDMAAIDALSLLTRRTTDEDIRHSARPEFDIRLEVQHRLEIVAIRKDLDLPKQASTASRRLLPSIARIGRDRSFGQAWRKIYATLDRRTAALVSIMRPKLEDVEVRSFAGHELRVLRAEEPRRSTTHVRHAALY